MNKEYHITETLKENPSSTDWITTGFVDKKIALFTTGTSSLVKEKEDELRKQGIYAVILRNPNQADVNTLKDYDFGPTYVTWHTPTSSYLDRIKNRKDISDKEKNSKSRIYRSKINTVKNYKMQTGELSDVNFNKWYELYEKTVLSKKYGVRLIPEDFIKQIGDVRKNFHEIMFFDSNDKIAAGLILESIPEKSILKIRASASDRSDKNHGKHFILRAQEEVFKIAKDLKLKTISYGTDPAYYGEVVSIGLEQLKASLGYQPLLSNDKEEMKEITGSTRLIKILNEDDPYILFRFSDRQNIDSDLEIKTSEKNKPSNYKEPWSSDYIA